MTTKECFGAFLWIDGTQPSVFVSLDEVEIYLVFRVRSHFIIREPCWSHCQTEFKIIMHITLYITSKVSARGPTTPWSWSDIYRVPSQAHPLVMFVSWLSSLSGILCIFLISNTVWMMRSSLFWFYHQCFDDITGCVIELSYMIFHALRVLILHAAWGHAQNRYSSLNCYSTQGWKSHTGSFVPNFTCLSSMQLGSAMAQEARQVQQS